MAELFERVSIFTTKPVVGQYRYKNKFQIYPSKRRPIQKGRFFYPLTIEISFQQKGEHYFRYSTPFGRDQLTKQIVEIQHLLSVVTQFFFFDHIKSKSPIRKFTNKTCGLIEKGTINWYQDKALDDRNVENFVIPEFIDSILEIYYALPKELLLVFRKACYLFYCGVELRGTNPSFSFASFVSAIETLMAYGAKAPNHCKECGQPKYRLRERFRKFIFSFGYGGNESAGARKFINKLYNHRSKMGRILFTQGLARRNKSMFNKLDIFYCELITIQWSRRRVDSGFTLRPCKLGSYLGHCSPETLGENNNRKKVN